MPTDQTDPPTGSVPLEPGEAFPRPALGDTPVPHDLALRAGDDAAGGRLDVFLSRALSLTRSQVRRLLAQGQVEVDARPVGSAAKGLLLEAGASIAVRAFRRPEHERAAPDPAVDVELLAQGEGWLAVDKPAGVPVHPLVATESGTVLGALLPRFPSIHGVGEGGLRSGVVHRLDVETSGVLLVASEEACWRRLRAAFRAHRVRKRYRAVVEGELREALALELPLVVASHRPARVRVARAGERGAVATRAAVRVLESFDSQATLVEIDLHTGFLHQIRATLAHAGHPVLGDPIYGSGPRRGLAERQLLHCAHIAVDEIDATSPDPPDFVSALAALRRPEAGAR